MFCKKCGTNNPPVARFCENCGIKLTADSGRKKTTDGEKDVPLSLVIAVIVVILVVAAIFAALSLI